MRADSKILITGGSGLVGHALLDLLQKRSYNNLLAPDRKCLDLADANHVYTYFRENAPEYVFHLAARVGGIKANSEKPAEFIRENLCMQTNVIDAAYRVKVRKLVFMACSCIYPKQAAQPLQTASLFEGKPEPTNEAFAYAKIAGIKMCQAYNRQYGTNFITAIPANAYGEYDNYSPEDSHVISALIRKVYTAKAAGYPGINLWGTGTPQRELLFAGDLASALVFCMQQDDLPEIINIGSGEETTISELAKVIMDIFEYRGRLEFDTSRPDGMIRKVLDSTVLRNMGWRPEHNLENGLRKTIAWFLDNIAIKENTN
jgi:GDP-L-fucose synthase